MIMEKMNMERPANYIRSIFSESPSIEEACREILKYLSTDNFDSAIENENTKISQLFDLSVRYLDKDYASSRDEIAEQIKTLIDNL